MAGNRRLAIIKAPSILGLRPTGVEAMGDALLDAGLAQALGADIVATVQPPAYDPVRDRYTGMLNAPAIATYAAQLGEAVRDSIERDETPVVLGGDCSILLGPLLALRSVGRYGLLFLDGHADFYQPEANVNGESASSELAFATGRGPAPLATLGGYPSLVRDEDVVLVGQRDAAEADHHGSQPVPESIRVFDLDAVRSLGAGEVGRLSANALDAGRVRGSWVHLDVDALSDDIMPAVDYRQPDGLSWNETREIMAPVVGSIGFAGIDVTIFNPSLDADGAITRALVTFLGDVLRPEGRT